MHDLIAHYSINHIDSGIPVYEDCRFVMDGILDEIEYKIRVEPPCLMSTPSKIENKTDGEQTGLGKVNSSIEIQIFVFLGRYSQRRRHRRDTFTSADLFSTTINSKGTTSSSPIPITHTLSQYSQHSSSQPVPTGYRRIHSPLTIDSSNLPPHELSIRRYSASAAVSPPHHHHNLQVPPIFNLIPPSPQQIITQDSLKKLTDRQWHIPILLYGCNKGHLASSFSNEQKFKNTDSYIDCTKKEDNESTSGITVPTTNASVVPNIKPRKRGREYIKIEFVI